MSDMSCAICGTTLFNIKGSEFNRLRKTLKPVFKSVSLPQEIRDHKQIPADKELFRVCPKCDAYALGIDTDNGAELLGADGRVVKISDLGSQLWSR